MFRGEIKCLHVKALQAAAISPFMISPHPPDPPRNECEQVDHNTRDYQSLSVHSTHPTHPTHE